MFSYEEKLELHRNGIINTVIENPVVSDKDSLKKFLTFIQNRVDEMCPDNMVVSLDIFYNVFNDYIKVEIKYNAVYEVNHLLQINEDELENNNRFLKYLVKMIPKWYEYIFK